MGYELITVEKIVWRRRRRRRLVRWAILTTVALTILSVLGVSVYVGWNLSHAEPRPVDADPAELGLVYEAVEFESSDGLTLRGWFLPADNRPQTIIFVHGYLSNRLQPSVPALELARSLVDNGFNVLMFDLRNSGESDGDVTTLGYHEVKDVYGAVKWLKSEKAAYSQQIGLIGFSMGAVTAILAAASESAIEAVVADSPFSDLRSYLKVNIPRWTGLLNIPFTWTTMAILPSLIDLDVDAVSPRSVISDLTQPIFLIHTDRDDLIPVDESKILAEVGSSERTQLWVVPSTKHVGAREVDPETYDAQIITFFQDALDVQSP